MQVPSQYEAASEGAPPADKLTQGIQALPLEQYGDQSTSCWSAYMLGCIHLAFSKHISVFASETDHMKLHGMKLLTQAHMITWEAAVAEIASRELAMQS